MNELDLALERIHLCAFETAQSEPNRGSIAAEALEWLGHSALISGVMDVYLPRLPRLESGRCLDEDQWPRSRGSFARAADWLATFELALADSSWQEVLCGAFEVRSRESDPPPLSLHGIVRLGHAVRSLGREDSEARRQELAFALAYAMARSEPAAPRVDAKHWIDRVRDLAPREDSMGDLLGAVCLQGAEAFLAHPERRAERSIGVIAPSAFRILLPHLPESGRQPILIALLSQLASSLATQVPSHISDETGNGEGNRDLEVERCAQSLREIGYRAACSVHDDAIIMAAACLAEEALVPSQTLRRAAATAALRLSPPGYREWR